MYEYDIAVVILTSVSVQSTKEIKQLPLKSMKAKYNVVSVFIYNCTSCLSRYSSAIGK
jgi:hypothetical protein